MRVYATGLKEIPCQIINAIHFAFLRLKQTRPSLLSRLVYIFFFFITKTEWIVFSRLTS